MLFFESPRSGVFNGRPPRWSVKALQVVPDHAFNNAVLVKDLKKKNHFIYYFIYNSYKCRFFKIKKYELDFKKGMPRNHTNR